MVDVPSVPNIAESATWEESIPELQNGFRITGGPPNPAADEGLANWPIQKLANRTGWLKAAVDDLRQSADVEVTVGAGGQYASINEALTELSRRRPAFRSGGFNAIVRLLAGFIMSEQVVAAGVNLGWIRITGVDALTIIRRSALTSSVVDRYPAFAAVNGGTLPEISQVFQMDTTGTATNRDGVLVNGPGAAVRISANCGVRSAGEDGLHVRSGGVAAAGSADFSNAGGRGLYVLNATVAAPSINLSGAMKGGLYAQHAAQVHAQAANISGCTEFGVQATHGATVSAQGANCRMGGSDGPADIVVAGGGMIATINATGGTSQTINTITGAGIIFR